MTVLLKTETILSFHAEHKDIIFQHGPHPTEIIFINCTNSEST